MEVDHETHESDDDGIRHVGSTGQALGPAPLSSVSSYSSHWVNSVYALGTFGSICPEIYCQEHTARLYEH